MSNDTIKDRHRYTPRVTEDPHHRDVDTQTPSSREVRLLRLARIVYVTALLALVVSSATMAFSYDWAKRLDPPRFLDVLVFWTLAEISVVVVFLLSLIVAMRALRYPIWACVGVIALTFIPFRTLWFVFATMVVERRAYLAMAHVRTGSAPTS